MSYIKEMIQGITMGQPFSTLALKKTDGVVATAWISDNCSPSKEENNLTQVVSLAVDTLFFDKGYSFVTLTNVVNPNSSSQEVTIMCPEITDTVCTINVQEDLVAPVLPVSSHDFKQLREAMLKDFPSYSSILSINKKNLEGNKIMKALAMPVLLLVENPSNKEPFLTAVKEMLEFSKDLKGLTMDTLGVLLYAFYYGAKNNNLTIEGNFDDPETKVIVERILTDGHAEYLTQKLKEQGLTGSSMEEAERLVDKFAKLVPLMSKKSE